MQEIGFFEEGEPMIDGEPGDLQVGMLDAFVTLSPSSQVLAFISAKR